MSDFRLASEEFELVKKSEASERQLTKPMPRRLIVKQQEKFSIAYLEILWYSKKHHQIREYDIETILGY
jgi:hypothetical protein